MACKTLARLCHGAPLDDGYMQVTPPVVHSIIPICMVGNDDTGNKLVSLLESCGATCRNVDTRIIKNSRTQFPGARTALAVLPIYRDGRRGCFFDAASNATFSPQDLTKLMESLSTGSSGPALDTSHMSYDDLEIYRERLDEMTPTYGAFLFGYPHLLPMLQGTELAQILLEARTTMIEGGIIALDLNGVPQAKFAMKDSLRTTHDLMNDPVIGPALEHVDILHMNQDELSLLTGCRIEGNAESEIRDEIAIADAVDLFLKCGVAVVAVTRGKKGSYVACGMAERFRPML
jgi:sugar/nucleoside kinase (ribokinase family)